MLRLQYAMPNADPMSIRNENMLSVRSRRCPGIYNNWDECRKNTVGLKNQFFKVFKTMDQAQGFLSNHETDTSCPSSMDPEKNENIEDNKALLVPINASSQPFHNPQNANESKSRRFDATLFFDGGCRKNLGIAGAGIYLHISKTIPQVDSTIMSPKKDIALHKIRWYCGSNVTESVAEYTGLLKGLQILLPMVQEFLEEETNQDTNTFNLKRIQPSLNSTVQVQVNGDSQLLIDIKISYPNNMIQQKQSEEESQLFNGKKEKSTVLIKICGDAKFIIDPIQKEMSVKHPQLKDLHASCVDLVQSLQSYPIDLELQHVYRDENKIADALANEAMDQCRSWATIENAVEISSYAGLRTP